MLNRMFMKAVMGLLLGCFLSLAGATETVIYYHNDALGSPIAATNAAGQVVWREQYEPYGKRLMNEPKSRNQLWYTGKPEEETLGLSYFGARWYAPGLGRFMGMDPVEAQAENLHSFNRYAYANNNPYRFVDPDGNSPLDVGFFIADSIRFGLALYSGNVAAIQSAGIDLAASAVGLASPVPGMGQALKAARAADKVADIATKTTILGENMMERVIPFAERTGARILPFGTTADKWAKMTPKQRWKLNDGTLRGRIKEGDNFRYIGQDPYRDPALRRQFDLTRSELQRLQDRSVPFERVSPQEIQRMLDRP
jgi:RHS repeat-associated protein